MFKTDHFKGITLKGSKVLQLLVFLVKSVDN